MSKISIHWFRRDLRVDDNTALLTAAEHCDFLIPLFIFDDKLLQSERASAARIAFMVDCLHALDESLWEHGTQLVIRRGDPMQVLLELIEETGATTLTYNRDYSPYSYGRDKPIKNTLREQGISVFHYKDIVMHESHEIMTQEGNPYQIFTPYKKRWLGMSKSKPRTLEGNLPPLPDNLDTGSIPEEAEVGGKHPPQPITSGGEKIAKMLLEEFVTERIVDYGKKRDVLSWETSGLSPHLRFGTISIRRCYYMAVLEGDHSTDGVKAWVSELAWRDFYNMVLRHNPQVIHQSYRPEYDLIEWENDPELFRAWCEGRTGYPIVDAAMRQLLATGWMHNRARMVVSSFLCKDLHIDWRWGEKFFMQHLIDGDTAANNGGWQWSAGTGTDAAPYFRIFNPVSQGINFDKYGQYIRQWVPELEDLPHQLIHTPWHLPEDKRRLIDYPNPIVDHVIERRRTLEMYKAARAAAAGYETDPEETWGMDDGEEDVE